MPNKELLHYNSPDKLPPTQEIETLLGGNKDGYVMGVVTAERMTIYGVEPSHVAVIGRSRDYQDAIGQTVIFEDGKPIPTVMIKDGELFLSFNC